MLVTNLLKIVKLLPTSVTNIDLTVIAGESEVELQELFLNPWLCRRNISILQLDKTIFMVIFAFRYNVKISCPLKNPRYSRLVRSHDDFKTNNNHSLSFCKISVLLDHCL